MSWWENLDEEFVAFLDNLFTGYGSLQYANSNALQEGTKKKFAQAGQILKEQEEAGKRLAGSTPTPTPSAVSPSPSSTSSAPPVLSTSSSQDEFARVKQMADAKMASTQRQTQGSILGVDPDAAVFEKREKKMGFAPSGMNARDVEKKMVTSDVTRTLAEVVNDVYGWDDKKIKAIADQMVDAGYLKTTAGVDRMDIAGIWSRLAATSALMFSKGERVSPYDLLKNQSFGLVGGTTAPKTVTSVDTDYTVTNATTAKQLAQAALSQRVGRKATDDEVAEFIAELRKEEKANPTVRTTTTTTNAAGTSQSSTSTTKQGVNIEAFQRQYADDYDTEEAKAYQAAGYYAPIFFDSLKAPA